MTPQGRPARNGWVRRGTLALQSAAVKLRLPFDAPLPDRKGPRAAVLLMLTVGGLVALLVPIVFAVMLLGMIRGG